MRKEKQFPNVFAWDICSIFPPKVLKGFFVVDISKKYIKIHQNQHI